MFGKKTGDGGEIQTDLSPKEQLEALKKSTEQRIQSLIVSNNVLVEHVRYWKHQYEEQQTELELIRSGAIATIDELKNRVQKLEKKVDKDRLQDSKS